MFRAASKSGLCLNGLNLKVQYPKECQTLELLKGLSVLVIQQKRGTAILKRQFPIHPLKMHKELRDRKLVSRHFVYDLIEETNAKKRENLELLLIQPVEGIGLPGDVVNVHPHPGRNFLLLPGLAVYASPQNLKKYSDFISQSAIDTPSSRFVLETVKRLEGHVFSATMNLENPWEIERWHIRIGFRKGGFSVPENAITLPSQPIKGPDLNLEHKEFLVKVKVNNKEEARVRFRVHHVATDARERLPWKDKHWLCRAKPIFEEEADILGQLNDNDPNIKDDEE